MGDKAKNRSGRTEDIKSTALYAFVSALLAFIILAFAYNRAGLVPFVNWAEGSSLAYDDAFYQFIDFMAFFRDVLTGKQSLTYGFSSYLGQNNIALFSYYLGSPFNLLLLIFKKKFILIFFDCAILLKLCMSALTFSIFLSGRFGKKLPFLFNICLSVGYGLMQYLLHQAYNINYLDGMYMLPLMMLGVYRAVKYKKTGLLSVSTGLSILFNWYTGCVNCLFSFVFFIVETALLYAGYEKGEKKDKWYAPVLRYGFAMLPGVLLSAVYLVPVFFELRLGKASELDLYLFGKGFKGDPLKLIHEYYLTSGLAWNGMTNDFFCGTIALLGLLGLFTVSGKAIRLREKIVFVALLFFLVMMIYYRPLYLIFSLLKKGAGHAGRYVYLGSFIILYLAGFFYSAIEHVRWRIYAAVTAAYTALFIWLHIKEPVENIKAVMLTCLSIAAGWSILFAYGRLKSGGEEKGGALSLKKIAPAALIIILLVSELAYNSASVLKIYRGCMETEFEIYEEAGQALADRIKSYDNSFYRITQTQNRTMDYNATTANYNEPLAFGYPSIDGYTSTPHGDQLDFFERAGYRNEGATPSLARNIVFLPFDSLMGVKYVMSPFEINGLEKIDEIEGGNGKDVYLNPYALPLMCKAEKPEGPVNAADPFEYGELMINALTGDDCDYLIPLEFEKEDGENTRTYKIPVKSGCAFYGYIPWDHTDYDDVAIDINGRISKPYTIWNSDDLFYIPVDEGEDSAYVTISGFDVSNVTAEMFYAVDLNALSEALKPLKAGGADNITVDVNKVTCSIDGSVGEWLFTSIPMDKGWTIKRNGKVIRPEVFEDCLMMLPLEDGHNEISMTYHIPYLVPGIIISLIGAAGIIIKLFYEKALLKDEQRTEKETP